MAEHPLDPLLVTAGRQLVGDLDVDPATGGGGLAIDLAQGAAVRGKSLIITLPGKPAAIGTSLQAVFASVPYCLDLIGAGRIETDPDRIKAFRPKS